VLETVDEDIVIALAEEGGMMGFGAGVGGAAEVFTLVGVFEVVERGFGVSAVTGLDGDILGSSSTGFNISSTCALFLGTTAGGGVPGMSAILAIEFDALASFI